MKKNTSREWVTTVSALIGLLILLSSVIFTFVLFNDKASQIKSIRARAISAEERQKREEKSNDATILSARKEREFYRQLECSNIAHINGFITVLSQLIIDSPNNTPKQLETIKAFSETKRAPFLCDAP